MNFKLIDGGICAVEGVRAWGIKEEGKGLALIVGEGRAAGVFTENKIMAAPLFITQKHLSSGRLSAIIANSGNANSFTGNRGVENAEKMAGIAAEALGIDSSSVAVASTGKIGRQLDMVLIEKQFSSIFKNLKRSQEASDAAARAIMTTDSRKKEIAIELDGVHIGAIAKGSGMIDPKMGTMLSFIYTDADIAEETLKRCLKSSTDKSFNMVVVDGDMSTNDMALLVATAHNGKIEEERFQRGLDFVCMKLARMMARDGEGATKLITAIVTGAKSQDDARMAAKSIVRSNLVKCAIFGEDPNWGRVIAAIGSSSAEIDPKKITLKFGNGTEEVTFVENGEIIQQSYTYNTNNIMKEKDIIISVDFGIGDRDAVALGCDLSDEYVRINAEYV
ncbi:MAG: bifunctional ornithine acetyltransferase/N-acetylglutamate synthase [Halobacteriota archaeon]|nr:bifunctional ornithine acetyltransferase/N-acetylglutamate synthase [Halobacteriota archaeon]